MTDSETTEYTSTKTEKKRVGSKLMIVTTKVTKIITVTKEFVELDENSNNLSLKTPAMGISPKKAPEKNNFHLNSPEMTENRQGLPDLETESGIYVRTMTGKTIFLDIYLNSYVLEVKGLIEHKEQILIEDQKLIFNGKELDDKKKLYEYGITKDSVIHMLQPYC